MFLKPRKKRIYLDTAAATPVSPQVLKAMLPYFTDIYGNAGAIHQEGVAAKTAIETARARLATALHVRPQGIVFTGSGTESNNLAILGALEARHDQGVSYSEMEIITTQIEHPSVLKVCAYAQSKGVQITYTPLTNDGGVVLESFKKCLSPKTVLVVLAYANSEIGVVQDVGALARIVRSYEREHAQRIQIHIDAAQAPLWLPCTLDLIGSDSLTLDAGKCNGPKGIGVLAFKHGVQLMPVVLGGEQEQGLRAGTENTALIIGAVEAICYAQAHWKIRSEKVAKLRDGFIERISTIGGVVLNGPHHERIANNVNISVPGIDSEFAVITLDEQGVASSTKSACGGAKGDGSQVVRALTGDEARALSTIRFTLHERISAQDLMLVASLLEKHIVKMRATQQKLTSK